MTPMLKTNSEDSLRYIWHFAPIPWVNFNPYQHGYKHLHIGTTRVNFDPVYIFCQIDC